ncbi:MAG: hypothetical protein WDN28_12720 [Chthoniobacter sp.]
MVLGQIRLSELLKRAGREKEAQEVAREALDHWEIVPRSRVWKCFEFALATSDFDTAAKIIAATADDRQGAPPAFRDQGQVNYRTRLASALASQHPADPRIVPLLTGALRISYSVQKTNLSNLPLRHVRSALQQTQEFPYGSISASPYQPWSEIYGIASQCGQAAAMKAAIAGDMATLPPGPAANARLAQIPRSRRGRARRAASRRRVPERCTAPAGRIDARRSRPLCGGTKGPLKR